MAWTINNGKLYFNTKLYTGNGASSHAISGAGFQPDLVWLKNRSDSTWHQLIDAVRGTGAANTLASNSNEGDGGGSTNQYGFISALSSDGFTVSAGTSNASVVNHNGNNYASWNWIGAGTAPSNTYAVKVVSDGGNKYRFDDFGTSAVTLEISEGGTFTFDQSDSSNNGHPLRFATQADAANSSQYTTGVTTNGTPGQAGAYTRITVAASAPTLYYYCSSHSGMGGQANTPVTNSFSNFAGSIQSNISPNTTSGFSIVAYSGSSASSKTIGHGLSAVPKMIIVKCLSAAENWAVYHHALGNTHALFLNTNGASSDTPVFADTTPTSSVFSVSADDRSGADGKTYVAYVFAEKQGYSKFGSYVGNGNADGTFVYTGFKPAFVLLKHSSGGTDNWNLYDNKRLGYNANYSFLIPNESNAENTGATTAPLDLLSNGFKIRASTGHSNSSGETYIYMAFAKNPFTSSAGTPVTAR